MRFHFITSLLRGVFFKKLTKTSWLRSGFMNLSRARDRLAAIRDAWAPWCLAWNGIQPGCPFQYGLAKAQLFGGHADHVHRSDATPKTLSFFFCRRTSEILLFCKARFENTTWTAKEITKNIHGTCWKLWEQGSPNPCLGTCGGHGKHGNRALVQTERT